jgi:hypothetical protein
LEKDGRKAGKRKSAFVLGSGLGALGGIVSREARSNLRFGERSSIAQVVQGYCRQAGIENPMSPHRIRHSNITYLISGDW